MPDAAFWADAMALATPESPTQVGRDTFAALEAEGADWFVTAKAEGRIRVYVIPDWVVEISKEVW